MVLPLVAMSASLKASEGFAKNVRPRFHDFEQIYFTVPSGQPTAGFSDRNLNEQMVDRVKKTTTLLPIFFHVLIQSSTFQCKPKAISR